MAAWIDQVERRAVEDVARCPLDGDVVGAPHGGERSPAAEQPAPVAGPAGACGEGARTSGRVSPGINADDEGDRTGPLHAPEHVAENVTFDWAFADALRVEERQQDDTAAQ